MISRRSFFTAIVGAPMAAQPTVASPTHPPGGVGSTFAVGGQRLVCTKDDDRFSRYVSPPGRPDQFTLLYFKSDQRGVRPAKPARLTATEAAREIDLAYRSR